MAQPPESPSSRALLADHQLSVGTELSSEGLTAPLRARVKEKARVPLGATGPRGAFRSCPRGTGKTLAPALMLFKPLSTSSPSSDWTGRGVQLVVRSPLGRFLPPPRGPGPSRERGRGAWWAPHVQCTLYVSIGCGDPGLDATGRDRLLPEFT